MYSFAFGRSSVFDINSLVDVACVARFTAARPAVGFNFAFFCYCSQQNKSKSSFFYFCRFFCFFFRRFLIQLTSRLHFVIWNKMPCLTSNNLEYTIISSVFINIMTQRLQYMRLTSTMTLSIHVVKGKEICRAQLEGFKYRLTSRRIEMKEDEIVFRLG